MNIFLSFALFALCCCAYILSAYILVHYYMQTAGHEWNQEQRGPSVFAIVVVLNPNWSRAWLPVCPNIDCIRQPMAIYSAPLSHTQRKQCIMVMISQRYDGNQINNEVPMILLLCPCAGRLTFEHSVGWSYFLLSWSLIKVVDYPFAQYLVFITRMHAIWGRWAYASIVLLQNLIWCKCMDIIAGKYV